MTPFYKHLTGFGGGFDLDRAGLLAAGVVGGGLAAHGLIRLGARFSKKKKEEAPPPPTPVDEDKKDGGES